MRYMTAVEASEKWGVSLRQVQRIVAEGQIPDVQKFGRACMLPADTEKPVGLRKKRTRLKSRSFADPAHMFTSAAGPMPANNPDAILDTIDDERVRCIYEGGLTYLRGDFAQTVVCFQKTSKDVSARLCICLLATAAAISMGDYRTYHEMETWLKDCVKDDRDGCKISVFAELALAAIAARMLAPHLAPDWLKEGEFSAFPKAAYPWLIYLRAKYFQCIGNYEAMLAAAQTALTFCSSECGITVIDIYLRLTCAVACHCLDRRDEAVRYLQETMRICLPHGFITPFAECISELGGLVERCVEQEFPHYSRVILAQWKNTIKHGIAVHNQLTEGKITAILSLREYHIALLAAQRIPYAKIAKQQGISVGRLKNIMIEIYEKLYISSRDELAQYIVLPKRT